MSFKSITIFLAGAAVGAVASYFFTKEKVERQAQATIDDMEKVFQKRYSGEEDPASDSIPENAQGDISEKTPDAKKEPAINKSKKKTDYTKFDKVRQKILYNKPLKYDDSSDTKIARRKTDMGEPYIIGEEEFENLVHDGWDMMEVNFDPSAVDNMYFYDLDGNEVSMDSIGHEAFAFLNGEATEDEIVYVKNEDLGMVFEITFDTQSCDEDE